MTAVRDPSDIAHLIADGIPLITARAIVTLLELHSMECYLASKGDNRLGVYWRVQYLKDSYKIRYVPVELDKTELSNWIFAVNACEKAFGPGAP